jgi:hypothetical protein
MKHFLEYNQVLENMAQAKAILRKNNTDHNDERFQKIVAITNRDGYTGLMTKYVFNDGADTDEIKDLYQAIRAKNINAGDIVKLSYNDVIDFVFADEQSNDKDIEFMFEYNEYKVFRVKTYDAGLTLNSPAWCLKTMSNYRNYTEVKNGKNIVAIKKDFIKHNVIMLPTPNSYFGAYYTNSSNPSVRIGITVYPTGRYDHFDDDNRLVRSNKHIVDDIVNKAMIWFNANEKFTVQTHNNNYDDFREFAVEQVDDFDYGSFDLSFYNESINSVNDVNTYLNIEYNGLSLRDYFISFRESILGDEHFIACCGFMDAILYTVYDKEFPLSGMYMNERENYDMCTKFAYGFHKHYWGRAYLLQSYESPKHFFKAIIELDGLAILFGGEHDYGSLLHYSSDNITSKTINDYISYTEEEKGFIVKFRIDDFNKKFDIEDFDELVTAIINNYDNATYNNGVITLPMLDNDTYKLPDEL